MTQHKITFRLGKSAHGGPRLIKEKGGGLLAVGGKRQGTRLRVQVSGDKLEGANVRGRA